MAQRRFAPINAPMTEAAKAEDVTITGDWTFTGTVDLDGAVTASSSVTVDGGNFQFNSTEDTTYAEFYTPGNAFSDAPLRIKGAAAAIRFEETDQVGGNEKFWTWGAGSRAFRLRCFNDDGVTSGEDAIVVNRTDNAATIDDVEIPAELKLTKARSTLIHSLNIENSNPQIRFMETGTTADEGGWNLGAADDDFYLRGLDDLGNNGGTVFQVTRVGDVPDNFRFETAQVTLRAGGILQLNDSVNSDTGKLQMTSDGALNISSTEHIALKPAASHAVQIVGDSSSQAYLDIFNSAATDKMRMYHNGTDFYETATNTTWIRRDGLGSGALNLNGFQERWYASGNLESIRITHDGNYGKIDLGNDTASRGIRCVPATSGTDAGWFVGNLSAADEATVSLDIPAGGGIMWLVCSNTTIAQANDMFQIIWQNTTICEVIYERTANILSLGTGTNPDVDGDCNVWFTNTGTTLNIKNRRGSFRNYNIFIIGGRV